MTEVCTPVISTISTATSTRQSESSSMLLNHVCKATYTCIWPLPSWRGVIVCPVFIKAVRSSVSGMGRRPCMWCCSEAPRCCRVSTGVACGQTGATRKRTSRCVLHPPPHQVNLSFVAVDDIKNINTSSMFMASRWFTGTVSHQAFAMIVRTGWWICTPQGSSEAMDPHSCRGRWTLATGPSQRETSLWPYLICRCVQVKTLNRDTVKVLQ